MYTLNLHSVVTYQSYLNKAVKNKQTNNPSHPNKRTKAQTACATSPHGEGQIQSRLTPQSGGRRSLPCPLQRPSLALGPRTPSLVPLSDLRLALALQGNLGQGVTLLSPSYKGRDNTDLVGASVKIKQVSRGCLTRVLGSPMDGEIMGIWMGSRCLVKP